MRNCVDFKEEWCPALPKKKKVRPILLLLLLLYAVFTVSNTKVLFRVHTHAIDAGLPSS